MCVKLYEQVFYCVKGKRGHLIGFLLEFCFSYCFRFHLLPEFRSQVGLQAIESS